MTSQIPFIKFIQLASKRLFPKVAGLILGQTTSKRHVITNPWVKLAPTTVYKTGLIFNKALLRNKTISFIQVDSGSRTNSLIKFTSVNKGHIITVRVLLSSDNVISLCNVYSLPNRNKGPLRHLWERHIHRPLLSPTPSKSRASQTP